MGGLPLVGEEPALLQLYKWGPSHPKLDLSEFREAFISPTRRLLLLLSLRNEALLVPLLTGEFSQLLLISCKSLALLLA